MFGSGRVKKQQTPAYATRGDFCRIFEKDMNRLYLLSFLLTRDQDIAEQCFVGGLHIAQEGNPVFKEWAEAWARRAIILNAIRMMRPRLTGDMAEPSAVIACDPVTDRAEFAEILKLPVFERFAFVMSVLEGYSDHESALHLGCTRAEVTAARSRALERMSTSAQLYRNLVNIASGQNERNKELEPQAVQGFSSLAASA